MRLYAEPPQHLRKGRTRSWGKTATVAALIALVCCSGEPSSYEDCVLEALDGSGKSDAVADLIDSACREKFPQEIQPPNELNAAQLQKLTGRAGPKTRSFSDSVGQRTYEGSIHNGNKDVSVTEISFWVAVTKDEDKATRSYRLEFGSGIQPLSTVPFSFSIIAGDEGSDYSWGINSAKGKRIAPLVDPWELVEEELKRQRNE